PRVPGPGGARRATPAPRAPGGGAHPPRATAVTRGETRSVPAATARAAAPRMTGPPRAGIRLVRLYAASRRIPAAAAAIAACAVGLRLALIGHWDSYGALQLPLVFETTAATAVTVTAAS